jgi:uncharacterized protein (UPF0261 family)
MRTTAAECLALGREIGTKLAAACGPAAILFPTRGVSAIDRTGQPFAHENARAALLAGLRETHAQVPLIELDLHINDSAFAEAAAHKLLEMLRAIPVRTK